MAEPLKNIYTTDFFRPIVLLFEKRSKTFHRQDFLDEIFNANWPAMELKERYLQIAKVFHKFLPKPFHQAIEIQLQQLNTLQLEGFKVGSYEYLFYPAYIELYGLNDWKTSSHAMLEMTKYISCEFTIRPFLKAHPERTMNWLKGLSRHQHPNVRRFSSEGCRPKLPWGGNMKFLEQDPSPIFSILEHLMTDDSLFVRKSVANNLNDISKTHPQKVIDFCKLWKNGNPHSEWIIKHACRSLLKAGNSEVMELFEYANIQNYKIKQLMVETKVVHFGKSLQFEFEIENTSTHSATTRLEYGIYFLKANGQQSRKVFKISEIEMDACSSKIVKKQHPLIPLTTRKYYDGEHAVSLIVNGVEKIKENFRLKLI